MRAAAATLQAIADRLTAEGISIPRGGPWRTSNVDGVLRSRRLDAKPPRRRRHDRPLGRLQPSRSWATRSPQRRSRERSTRRPVAGPRALAVRRPADYYPAGAVACPEPSLPQQVMVPSVRSPHEWNQPAVTAEYCPSGAVACPSALRPQQVMVPLVRSPHE